MKKSGFAAVCIAAGLAMGIGAPMPVVHAQSIEIGPGGIHVNPDNRRPVYRDDRRARVSAREAQRIARNNGMRRVHEVRERRGNWSVTGTDRRGRMIRMTISSRNGNVLDVDRIRR